MDCQVRSMAASSLSEDSTIPEGKVEAVCREWLVREDGVLAYKLQTEEIQHHYGHNKERNQLVRSDLQEARSAQKSEEDEAIAVHLAYEKMLREQEDQDAFLAEQLQKKLLKEELEQQKQIEEEDERIALELQRKEKLRQQRKREERELRQAEKARAELSGASNSSSIKSMEDVICMKEAATSPLDNSMSLLSLEPPENLSPEEFQQFVQCRDAELAKLLQQQDARTQHEGKDDRQLAIEAQDRELAKVLQEQERARARKARERARQKAALAHQQDNNAISHLHYDNMDRGSSAGETSGSPEWTTSDQRNLASNFSGHPVTNIAAAIDPTFHHSQTPSIGSPSSQLSSPTTPLSSPLSDIPPYSFKDLRGEDYYTNGDEGSAAPPYMPIQGTRRPTSLEKAKKSKRGKDGCKTQ